MKTVFQKNIKKQDLIEVAHLLHPDVSKEVIEKNISYSAQYSWVTVRIKIRDYGIIDFCIDNHHQHKLYGGYITKEDMSHAIANGHVSFRIWRTGLDKLNDKDSTAKEIFEKLPREQSILDAQKFISDKYQLPSVEEFYSNYYSD